MHTHSFAFLVLTAYIFLSSIAPESIIAFMMLFIGLYVVISMKRFYGQSWRKTFFKFVLINVIYWLLLGVVMGITLLLSLALF